MNFWSEVGSPFITDKCHPKNLWKLTKMTAMRSRNVFSIRRNNFFLPVLRERVSRYSRSGIGREPRDLSSEEGSYFQSAWGWRSFMWLECVACPLLPVAEVRSRGLFQFTATSGSFLRCYEERRLRIASSSRRVLSSRSRALFIKRARFIIARIASRRRWHARLEIYPTVLIGLTRICRRIRIRGKPSAPDKSCNAEQTSGSY